MTTFSAYLEPLMEKPGWQRLAALAGCALVLVLMCYQFLLRGLWLEQTELKQQTEAQQLTFSRAQATLLHAPALDSLEPSLKENTPEEQPRLPLEQQFSQSLKDAQATLIRWQPATEMSAASQGELQLKLSFSSLMNFLSALQQQPEPPAFSELILQSAGSEMTASVLLTQTTGLEFLPENAITAVTQRDPFAVAASSSCTTAVQPLLWRLSGVYYAGEQLSGWLLSPEGRWTRVETGTQLGTPAWTIDNLDSSHAELSMADPRCGEQRQSLWLSKNTNSPGKGN
ncbi:pilus assembly protein PilO [Rahnella selenatireducens]|uniref:pilus assembly protein PilO n=1 Tax=Rahnella selenatireducens TaxID=3389797 RepID=UPI003967F9A9